MNISKSLVLVGLMGVGKSSVGRALAQGSDLPFIDADEEIEKASGCTIADYFEQYGEPAFREGEYRVTKRLLEGERCILATGGGAFMDERTRALIAERGISIWLKADLDLLVKRTAGRSHRPLLKTENPRRTLQALMDKRYPVYALADITIQAQDESPEETVARINRALEELKA